MVEYYGTHNQREGSKGHHVKFMIAAVFILIFLFIIMTSFTNDFPLTGGSIFTGGVISNELDGETLSQGMAFTSELTTPEIAFDGKVNSLEFVGGSDSSIKIGTQNFDLSGLSTNFVTLKEFNGKLNFNNERITILDGRAQEVIINGVSVKGSNRVELTGNFDYNVLILEEDISINEIKYNTSGSVSLNNGKETFSLEDDEISIQGFYGSINIQDDTFKADGHIKRLVIRGDSNIDISK